ncbi:MAG: M23 family metallopeptidase [Patescibacteria group bacterium]
MNPLALYYPLKPHQVTRAWGVPDPIYRMFGFERHNGVDLALTVGDEIRAPFACRVGKVSDEPNGSGIFVSLLSQEEYIFLDGKTSIVELTFMHLMLPLVSPGEELRVGELVALGGSTGFSTGSHTHLAPKRVTFADSGYTDVDTNDADNTFDPTPHWNGLYAEDLDADDERTLHRLERILRQLKEGVK